MVHAYAIDYVKNEVLLIKEVHFETVYVSFFISYVGLGQVGSLFFQF